MGNHIGPKRHIVHSPALFSLFCSLEQCISFKLSESYFHIKRINLVFTFYITDFICIFATNRQHHYCCFHDRTFWPHLFAAWPCLYQTNQPTVEGGQVSFQNSLTTISMLNKFYLLDFYSLLAALFVVPATTLGKSRCSHIRLWTFPPL